MTIYLPNQDVRPIGAELAEFIDAPPLPDVVAAVVDTCPSGALSYTRTDRAPNGRRGRARGVAPAASVAADADPVTSSSVAPAALVTITPRRNGPLSVQGPVGLTQPDGEVDVVERAVLCRCGHSANKPFCDGSHARVGFTALGV